MASVGDKLGPYTLHERINAGGQSEIWLATDEENRSFAVRLMLNDSMFAFGDRRRFMTGCETLQACQDGHYIIGYVEHGKIGGQLALVMEYVEGENLKLLMNAGDPVLTENIAEVLIEFASALEVVHDRGFMHLDVKPENVLLSRNGSLRLIDFDLAQPIPNPPRKLDRLSGTPAYMAPEQLLKQPVRLDDLLDGNGTRIGFDIVEPHRIGSPSADHFAAADAGLELDFRLAGELIFECLSTLLQCSHGRSPGLLVLGCAPSPESRPVI